MDNELVLGYLSCFVSVLIKAPDFVAMRQPKLINTHTNGNLFGSKWHITLRAFLYLLLFFCHVENRFCRPVRKRNWTVTQCFSSDSQPPNEINALTEAAFIWVRWRTAIKAIGLNSRLSFFVFTKVLILFDICLISQTVSGEWSITYFFDADNLWLISAR